MSSDNNRLFVGNLSWSTTDESLREAFHQYDVVEARVIIDRFSGRSRGFGFITFASEDGAVAAKNEMNNKEVDGRAVRVDLATSQRR